jgi:quinol-cytochrome oxidoreductase complex cytochrome b subunit
MELHNHSKENGEQVPFFPNVLLAEASLAVAVIGLIIISVSLFPLKLGVKFDPMNPPTILEPEWYFMGFYQFLKTQGVQPIHGMVMMAALAIFMVLVPFIDRSEERRPLRRPFFTAAVLFAACEFIGLTIFGYMSPGQVGSLSSAAFATAFAVTNSAAIVMVALVFALSRRTKRGGPE